MKNAVFQKHDECAVKDLGGGSSRRVLAWDGQLLSAEVSFEKGSVGALHSHPHTQLSYVLSGRFSYTVAGETVEMCPGDSIVVPSGAEHGTTCLEKGVLLDVFTPCREDFVK